MVPTVTPAISFYEMMTSVPEIAFPSQKADPVWVQSAGSLAAWVSLSLLSEICLSVSFVVPGTQR